MKEKGRETIHPDLIILKEIIPSRRGDTGMGKDRSGSSVGLVFTELGRSFWDHFNGVADQIDEGQNLVFLLAGTKEDVEMGRDLAKALREVGLMSTEFTKSHLAQAGHGKFVGGFSFRLVNPLKIT